MSKIVLNEKQIDALKKHLNGEHDPFFSPEEEQQVLGEVIDMAEALMFELDAVEESGDDLMAWFWGKYQEQEK